MSRPLSSSPNSCLDNRRSGEGEEVPCGSKRGAKANRAAQVAVREAAKACVVRRGLEWSSAAVRQTLKRGSATPGSRADAREDGCARCNGRAGQEGRACWNPPPTGYELAQNSQAGESATRRFSCAHAQSPAKARLCCYSSDRSPVRPMPGMIRPLATACTARRRMLS